MKKGKYAVQFALHALSLYVLSLLPLWFIDGAGGWWAWVNRVLAFGFWTPLLWFLLFTVLAVRTLRCLFAGAGQGRGEKICLLALAVLSLLNAAGWGIGALVMLLIS